MNTQTNHGAANAAITTSPTARRHRETDIRIGHRHDALLVLDEIIAECERGFEHPLEFCLPRLEALKDVITREAI